jgi:NADPH:quinone reductase-like Zn-dependent oxidoreductase
MDLLIETLPAIGGAAAREWKSTADFWRQSGAAWADPLHGAIVSPPSTMSLRTGELRVHVRAASPRLDGEATIESRDPRLHWGARPDAGFAGLVDAVSDEVLGLSVGDEIFGIAEVDALQHDGDSLIVAARVVARKPSRLTCQESASICLAAVGAWQMLFKLGRIERGETALILGAGTPVGHLAVQLAALYEVRTVAMKFPDDVEVPNCASRIIDSSEGCLEAQSRLASVIIDTIGGDPYRRACKSMRHGCSLVSCVERSVLSSRAGVRFYRPDTVSAACLARIAELIDSGLLKWPKPWFDLAS